MTSMVIFGVAVIAQPITFVRTLIVSVQSAPVGATRGTGEGGSPFLGGGTTVWSTG